MKMPVYLDYAATTPVDPVVAEKMSRYLTMDGIFANPASRSHLYGWQAEEAVETARRQVADLLGADPREIVWTSGATESNNLAIKGAIEAALLQDGEQNSCHIVTSMTEHKAVLDTCGYLQQKGIEVTFLKPQANGEITAQQVEQAIQENTLLVSVMHANNETGVINPVAAIGECCRRHGVLLHVDAAQSVGKIPVDVSQLNIDLLSVSAHKFYGPKGVGALYVRRHPDVRIQAQMHGGGHERNMRSGTLATHQIVGLGEACVIASATMEQESARIGAMRDQLWKGLQQHGRVSLNGAGAERLPGHLNVAFAGVDGEVLMNALNQVAVSSGSACTSATMEPSYVLKAMGLDDDLAHSSIRFSLGRFTEEGQIDPVVEHIHQVLDRIAA